MAITFVCGWECRIVGNGSTPAPDERPWTVVGIPQLSTATFRSGTSALQAEGAPVGAAGELLSHTVARTIVSGRVYVNFTTLPSAITSILDMTCSTAPLLVRVDNAGAVTAHITGGSAVSVGTVTTGVWYRLDFLADSSTGTRSLKVRLDGGAEAEATFAVATANITAVRLGSTQNVTVNVFFDDLIIGDATGDYPFGAGTVERMKPTRDGTHSFTAGDFAYNTAGGNVATSATDVWSYLDDDALSDTADLIRQAVIRSTGYVEVGFGTAPFTHDALAVEVKSSWHASATGANTVGLKMNDGGSLADMTDAGGDGLGDYSNTGITYAHKIVVTPPSTGTWTKAKIDALLLRMGYSGDVVGIPYCDGLMLEVAYAAVADTRVPYVNPMPPLIAQ